MRTSNCWRFISKGVSARIKLICRLLLEISDYLSMPVVTKAVIVQLSFQNPMKISLTKRQFLCYRLSELKSSSSSTQYFMIQVAARWFAAMMLFNELAQGLNIEVPGPLMLSGIGYRQSISEHGIYRVDLPLYKW